MSQRTYPGAIVCLSLSLLSSGCRRAPQVEITTFDAADVTRSAMQTLDSNGDAELSKDELKQCPGLAKARKELDRDNDGTVSKAELQTRLQSYVDEQIAILPIPIVVTYRRKPLIGATVELIPEPFLNEIIEPAQGVTDQSGTVRPSIQVDEAISSRGTYGYRSGVYRVKVSRKDPNGKELIPAKYNQDSMLGIEVKMEEHLMSLRLDLN